MKKTNKIRRLIKLYNTINISLSGLGKTCRPKVSPQRVWTMLKPFYSELKSKKIHVNGYTKINSHPAEEYVQKVALLLGFEVVLMPHKHWFDALINNKKCEIKHTQTPYKNKTGGPVWRFSQNITRFPVDFYIFVCGPLEQPTTYIVPAIKVTKAYTIPLEETKKRGLEMSKLYKEKWFVLDDFTP